MDWFFLVEILFVLKKWLARVKFILGYEINKKIKSDNFDLLWYSRVNYPPSNKELYAFNKTFFSITGKQYLIFNENIYELPSKHDISDQLGRYGDPVSNSDVSRLDRIVLLKSELF